MDNRDSLLDADMASPAVVQSPSAAASPRTFRIAVLPGGGIGPEVKAEAIRVLQAVTADDRRIRFDLHEVRAGAEEYRLRGNPLPAEALEMCRTADAVLLGAMGL